MRRVFITGGTGGIGSALVRAFSEIGHEVCFQFNGATDVAGALERTTGARGFAIDFLSTWTPPPIAADIFVHNAGINLSGSPFTLITEEEILDTLRVNVLTSLRFCQSFANQMKENRWGRVININSVYGLRAGPQRLSYNVSKGGLSSLTQSLAVDLAPFGVTVNQICPGPVDTKMLRRMAALAVANGRYSDTETYLASVAEGVPIGRLIGAREIADAAVFLASDGAAACTGNTLVVDGGLSQRWP